MEQLNCTSCESIVTMRRREYEEDTHPDGTKVVEHACDCTRCPAPTLPQETPDIWEWASVSAS